MTNDRFLIWSYLGCAALSIAAGGAVYLYLRRPFAALADAASGKHFPSILKKLLPFGLVFPALLGFVSVSYQSCGKSTYASIVASREYLVAKNQEQLASVMFSIVVAVLFWDVIALLILKHDKRGKNGPSSTKIISKAR